MENVNRISRSNDLRERIINEKLMDVMEFTSDSDRNKEIVTLFVSGTSQANIGKEYSISSPRVRQIILQYIRHAIWYKIRNGI